MWLAAWLIYCFVFYLKVDSYTALNQSVRVLSSNHQSCLPSLFLFIAQQMSPTNDHLSLRFRYGNIV